MVYVLSISAPFLTLVFAAIRALEDAMAKGADTKLLLRVRYFIKQRCVTT